MKRVSSHAHLTYLICCKGNKHAECLPQDETQVQKMGFDDYMQFTWVFFAALLVACSSLGLVSFAHDKYRHRHEQHAIHRQLTTNEDTKYALEAIGTESVYQFFLGNSGWGWVIVLSTMALHLRVLFVFVCGSEADLSDSKMVSLC